MTAPVAEQRRPKRRRRPPPPHGDHRRYRYWGCHCPECREAERLRAKRWREGRLVREFVPAIGTARRVQALVAYGWGHSALAAHLGCTDAWMAQLARADARGSRGVLRRTAAQVAELYDRLTAQPPPTGRAAAYARTTAARNGWVSPWAWDNIDDPGEKPKGVRPAVPKRQRRPEHPTLSREERREAIHQLWSEGIPDRLIAERLAMNLTTVRRARMRHGWTRPRNGTRVGVA